MEKQLTYEEAMQKKSFYLVGYWIVDNKNFYDLIKDTQLCEFLIMQLNKRIYPHDALSYYINNVISIDLSPKRVWSFACDISYWVTEDTKEDLSELIWFIINEMWYFDFVDENDIIVWVSKEVVNKKEKLFMNRLEMWFWCIMKDGRKLPRGRWIDTPTETTST